MLTRSCCYEPRQDRRSWRITKARDGWTVIGKCARCGTPRREAPFYDWRSGAEDWVEAHDRWRKLRENDTETTRGTNP